MNYESLSAEQREKVNACRTPEDVFKLAKDEGYELSDEEIQQISGGWAPGLRCPKCGGRARKTLGMWVCVDCGYMLPNT